MFVGRLIPWRNKATSSERDTSTPDNAINRFHSEIDRVFDRFFGDRFFGGMDLPELRSWAGTWAPTIDVNEGDDAFTVSAELPGVDPKDIDVSLSGDMLTIVGEKKEESEEQREGLYQSERRFGSFKRTIPLPASVDAEQISADYENGVLRIRVPKSKEAKQRRIPVSRS